MGPRFMRYMFICGVGLLAACGAQDESGAPTGPEFAREKPGCNATAIDKAVRTVFTDQTDLKTALELAQALTSAYGATPRRVGQVTWYSFQLVALIETDGRSQGGAQPSSDLALLLLGQCASVSPLPSNFVTELGPTGAFGVRGFTSSDAAAVISHDGRFILEPPSTWQSIMSFPSRTGITGDTAEVFLAFGRRGSPNDYTATGDVLLDPETGVFDWTTVPTATIGPDPVIVGDCETPGGFAQHFPANDPKAEVLGFIQPRQCPEAATGFSRERAPETFAARLFQALSPRPAYAAAALLGGSGGGSKPALSPFGIINPGHVNLNRFDASPATKGNVINQALTPAPAVTPRSDGGIPFKQEAVLVYLLQVLNNGIPGQICFNWVYTNDQGTAVFPRVFITKAGVYQLFARTVGTVTAPDPTGEAVPSVGEGRTVLSTAFNLKNSSTTATFCPSFDGTNYYHNILDPNAPVEQTFPPVEYPSP